MLRYPVYLHDGTTKNRIQPVDQEMSRSTTTLKKRERGNSSVDCMYESPLQLARQTTIEYIAIIATLIAVIQGQSIVCKNLRY